MAGTQEERQVRLAAYDSEPLARLTAQRLHHEEIPCRVQPVGVGPGGWGLAANLPHAVYVRASDEARARELLELSPPEDEEPQRVGSLTTRLWALGLIMGAAVVLVLADRLFGALLD